MVGSKLSQRFKVLEFQKNHLYRQILSDHFRYEDDESIELKIGHVIGIYLDLCPLSLPFRSVK